MRFFGYFRSSAAYRCRIALNLKGLKPELAFVHLRKGEQKEAAYRALNPQGLVPALETDEGALITQSLAIMEWLDERYPSPPLLPGTADDRAYMRSLAQIVACDIHPLQNLRVLNHLKSEFGQDQAGLDRWCRTWIECGLTAFDSLLGRSGKMGAFCCGDQPGMADACLAPQVFSAARFHADISGLKHIAHVMTACDAHPAFIAAHPARQPDTEA